MELNFSKLNKDGNETEWAFNTVNLALSNIDQHKKYFIEYKLKEKGYEGLIETYYKRFPKIKCFIKDNWLYVYADNGTVDGDFIVAIQDFTPSFYYDKNNYSTGTNIICFKWQDTSPL